MSIKKAGGHVLTDRGWVLEGAQPRTEAPKVEAVEEKPEPKPKAKPPAKKAPASKPRKSPAKKR